ncbi:uncharacterized protein BJX67DRAFT_342210 [Aspergillus lucknowensis]|uniref:Uncharacterized protein n=1 Tax=Aspergillus lucknowensis TaxID=176173 RepID=A0ABR4M4A3_9EURO
MMNGSVMMNSHDLTGGFSINRHWNNNTVVTEGISVILVVAMSGNLVVIDWARLKIRRSDVFCFCQLYSTSIDLRSIVCGVIMTTNSLRAVMPASLIYDRRPA